MILYDIGFTTCDQWFVGCISARRWLTKEWACQGSKPSKTRDAGDGGAAGASASATEAVIAVMFFWWLNMAQYHSCTQGFGKLMGNHTQTHHMIAWSTLWQEATQSASFSSFAKVHWGPVNCYSSHLCYSSLKKRVVSVSHTRLNQRVLKHVQQHLLFYFLIQLWLWEHDYDSDYYSDYKTYFN